MVMAAKSISAFALAGSVFCVTLVVGLWNCRHDGESEGNIHMKFTKSIGLATAVLFAASLANAATLDDVRKRGQLHCGINTGLPGFAAPDDKGVWRGFDVDFCRAVAAAVLGNAVKVKYTNLTGKTRFTALRSGEIDLLSSA
jgi:general L-amino acid transport system substrate-binding protein